MAYRGQGQKVQKVMVQPINLIFRYLQNRSRIQVWLYEQVNMRIEGCIIGFDEYMNLVLDDAEEIHSKTKSRKQLGYCWKSATGICRSLRQRLGILPDVTSDTGWCSRGAFTKILTIQPPLSFLMSTVYMLIYCEEGTAAKLWHWYLSPPLLRHGHFPRFPWYFLPWGNALSGLTTRRMKLTGHLSPVEDLERSTVPFPTIVQATKAYVRTLQLILLQSKAAHLHPLGLKQRYALCRDTFLSYATSQASGGLRAYTVAAS
ncbi:hypothetical protein E5288_WYG010483 [Bos mutus]|uniref:Small nuclear ribonucleoprotein E n=1 Tax=Bos mutus TaxID=72004 RepID=A0A6B0S535_9CETA|nr:hypothetical protein [Bos mutus]